MAVDWYEYSNTKNIITMEKVIKLSEAHWTNGERVKQSSFRWKYKYKYKNTPKQNNHNEKGTTCQLVESIQYKYIH